MCLYVVLWSLILSFLLPGMLGILTPGTSLLLIFFLFLFGGFVIINRVSVSNRREKILAQGDKTGSTVEVGGCTAAFTPSGKEGGADEKPVPALPLPETETEEDVMVNVEEPMKEVVARDTEKAAAREVSEAVVLFKEFPAPHLLPKESYYLESEKGVFLLPHRVLTYNELFESAFQARKECNYELAVENLRQSLDGTTDIFLKGMIYTELVFLYKEMGKYLEAAGMIQSFVSENGAKLVPSLVRQFGSLVNYLQTIDQILKKAEQPELPYSQVPRLIKLRAEKLLKE